MTPPAARREQIRFGFTDLCGAWIEGFQVQFTLAFRDGYATGEHDRRRPAPGNCSLPDRRTVVAMVCHVLGLPLAVAEAERYAQGTLSKTYRDGEREGWRIGFALGWQAAEGELRASQRIERLLEHGREPSEADWRALGDGTAGGAARRMMLAARLTRNLGVTMALPSEHIGD